MDVFTSSEELILWLDREPVVIPTVYIKKWLEKNKLTVIPLPLVAALYEAVRIEQDTRKHPMGELPAAVSCVRSSIQDDPELAWGWHCNIVMPMLDEGVPYRQANKSGARVMFILFGVDMNKNKYYQDRMRL